MDSAVAAGKGDGWNVRVDSEELISEMSPGVQAVDGSVATFWHTHWLTGVNMGDPQPHCIQIDLGQARWISGFYQGRFDKANGRVKDYELYLSNDPANLGKARASGAFGNVTTPQRVDLR